LPEDRAQVLAAELNRRGIAVSTAPDTADSRLLQLEVASHAVADAVQALGAGSVPEGPATSETEAIIPTRESERSARERRLAAELTRAIAQLPGVRRATVQLRLPEPRHSLSDLLGPPGSELAHATVSVVRKRADASQASKIRALLQARLPTLTDPTVLFSEEPGQDCTPCAALARVGTLTVTRESLTALKLWLGASLVLHMFGALTLLYFLRRRTRSR
jgi:type III secretory pathway lipoprotein EscJ